MMKDLENRIKNAIEEKRGSLCESIVERQYHLQPEIWEPYGEKGRQLSIRDSDHHFSYLLEALAGSDPSLFADYVEWLDGLFRGLKFPKEALTGMLESTGDVLRETLTEEMGVVTDQYINAAKDRLDRKSGPQPSFLDPDAPLHDLASRYLETLLKGERRLAGKLILDAVETGAPIKDIYLHVFQRSQYEIGRLWHINRVSVAQEHYCSAATQLIMSQLYTHIFSTEKIGRRLVAACVGGELHEIGIRMVADFFEMEGWDTYYMGANTPASSILEAVEHHNADVLGISAAMPFRRTELNDLVQSVRTLDGIKNLKIIVGGNALRVSPGLWKRMGADGFAEDAQGAVLLANRLIAGQAFS
jgi:MerR family transcriptional regulator, light-induced transcriptional regulator